MQSSVASDSKAISHSYEAFYSSLSGRAACPYQEPFASMCPMAAALPPELASFRFTHSIPVFWGDQDAFGHVNNTVYFRWMEVARIEYFEWSGLNGLMVQEGIGPILASIKCDFRRQLKYPDLILVSAKIYAVGGASMKMSHVIYSQTQQAVAAEGDSVIVAFDYQAQRAVRVSDAARTQIDAKEGRLTAS